MNFWRIVTLYILIFFVASFSHAAEKVTASERALLYLTQEYGGVAQYKREVCEKRVPYLLTQAWVYKEIQGEKDEARALAQYVLSRVDTRLIPKSEKYEREYARLLKQAAPSFSFTYKRSGSYREIIHLGKNQCWAEKEVIPKSSKTILNAARHALEKRKSLAHAE